VKIYRRKLDLDLHDGVSAFLWGPRKTGKTFYLRDRFPESTSFDFLKSDLFFEVSKRPAVVRERLLALAFVGKLVEPIILDEIQKIPALLDEVHWMIENKGWQFILCGSSPRKLKHGHANLLGGRAWRFQLHPLATPEIPDFDLLTALNRGLIPSHYAEARYRRSLKVYVNDYLREEIMEEGLVRNLAAFARFLDSIVFNHGQMVNFSSVARDCGVDAKTVKAYYQILIDTMLGNFVEPFAGKKGGREVISSIPKFYLFDVGVAGHLLKRQVVEERGELFGRAFEHFILMELLAYRSYSEKDFPIQYWRTKHGVEVDFILGGGAVAVEVKGGRAIDRNALKPLRIFSAECGPVRAVVVNNESEPRRADGIDLLPWRHFLDQLWSGKIL
jgi:predicted AAA+ superfamily ATPase